MSPRVYTSMLLKLLFLVQSVPLVQSKSTDVEKMLLSAEKSPRIAGTKCTSRTLRDILLESGNFTTGSVDFESENAPYCPDGYFCDLWGNENKHASDAVFGLCKACSGGADSCVSSSILFESTPSTESLAFFLGIAVEEECQDQCGIEENACSSTEDCPLGLFCNFEQSEEGGYCEQCPVHLYFCEEGRNLTSQGLMACESSCSIVCSAKGVLEITDETTSSPVLIENVNSMDGSPQFLATGPIVDCGLGLEDCEGAEGAVCFIERGVIPFYNKTTNCYNGGGIAAVIYNLESTCDNILGSFFGTETLIPTIALTYWDGKSILDQAKAMPLGQELLATVEVGGHDAPPGFCTLGCVEDNECEGTDLICNYDNGDFGDCKAMESNAHCSDGDNFLVDHLPCTAEREFCDFSVGGRGFCRSCPEVDGACFFSDLNSEGVKECNRVCTDGRSEKLDAAPCKFCPKGDFVIGDIGDGFETTEEKNATTPCEFCASTSATECSSVDRWDMKHPKRTISIFGTDVECWAVAEFYRSVNVEANTAECDSVRSFNYICGCSDSPGYAGAKTDSRKVALVWFPRVGAILSILGSSLMITSVLADELRRKKVIGELIIALSIFDIVGSLGYVFTSYPTPAEDYIHGAEGNQASCTAQGFFIQIGTISLYTNVSIAFYYLLIIQFSWREHRLRKSWVYYMLFAVPIVAGSIFAFAGIPFYDNAILWCNNSRKYWSEIPVAISILIATVVMMNLCWFVFKSERASERFRRHSTEDRTSLSAAFLYQSLIYLGAFYLTWPPYLALQMMIANGRAFYNYRFILVAGTAVTLQGFWNCIFHIGLNRRAIGKNINEVWVVLRSKAADSGVFLSTSWFSKEDSKFAKDNSRFVNEGSSAENISPL